MAVLSSSTGDLLESDPAGFAPAIRQELSQSRIERRSGRFSSPSQYQYKTSIWLMGCDAPPFARLGAIWHRFDPDTLESVKLPGSPSKCSSSALDFDEDPVSKSDVAPAILLEVEPPRPSHPLFADRAVVVGASSEGVTARTKRYQPDYSESDHL